MIASENSIPKLEAALSLIIGESVKVEGKKVIGHPEYSIKRNGVMYCCYETVKKGVLEEMITERNRLMLSNENPTRLAELKAKIDWLEWGIETKDEK